MLRRALLVILLALLAACSGTRTYVVSSAPPSAWRGLPRIFVQPINWHDVRVDGVEYAWFRARLPPDRQRLLDVDTAQANRTFIETLGRRVRGVRLTLGGGTPRLSVSILSWERGYYSIAPKATALRARVILRDRSGARTDVVEFSTTYHHTIYRPNPAAGVRNAAELLANAVSEWLMRRIRE